VSAKLVVRLGAFVAFSSIPLVIIFLNGWAFVLPVITGFLLIFSGADMAQREEKEKVTNNEKQIKDLIQNEGFTYDNVLFTPLNRSSLSFNESLKEIYFSDLNEVKKYSFSDILESRIEENGESIIRTSRSSQVGGAILGGILAGGVGAVVGGLSGEQKSETKVKSLDLVITIDDTKQPIHKVNLLKNSIGVSPTKKIYIDAKEKAEHWHGLISVFIRRAENKKIGTQ
jgi:hypothetical protein